MNRIQLQPGYEGREVFAAVIARPDDVLIFSSHTGDYSERNVTPVGDVEFCEEVMRKQGVEIPKPDFYPPWLCHWMHRSYLPLYFPFKVRLKNLMFLKSADSYKLYPARVFETSEYVPEGLNWACQPVTFTQEWRYYVSNGEVVTTGWYDGYDDDEPAPELNIVYPAGFCGAVDFGRLDTGEIALVECHHPYACGHYSDDNKAFVQWLIDGFNYMKANYSA